MAAITEDYVSFETAKLLKEKGFDVYGDGSFNSGIEVFAQYSPSGTLNKCSTCKPHQKAYSAPTLQMAMKWLRENKDFNINNELTIHGYFCSISHIVRDSMGHVIDIEDSEAWETPYYHTYEEAVEAAIKYCLENLI